MDNTYIDSMRAHLTQLESELNGLSTIVKARSLGQYEYRAAEHTLQITIEACIGIAKHWCKQLDQVAPTSAYQAFERLAEHGVIQDNKTQWKQIIGMRNALVHDYLNIDHKVIEYLLSSEQHHSLFIFARLGLTALTQQKN
jgi:uncharacterized protein YutE (UPF0331/DUF86 family)